MACHPACHMVCHPACHMACHLACHMVCHPACHMACHLACHMVCHPACHMACHLANHIVCHLYPVTVFSSQVKLPLLNREFLMERVRKEDVILNDRAALDILMEAIHFQMIPDQQSTLQSHRSQPRKHVAKLQVRAPHFGTHTPHTLHTHTLTHRHTERIRK